MLLVATLVTNPATPVLTTTLMAQAQTVLPQTARSEWLAEGIAADLFFEPSEPPDTRALADAIRAAMGRAPVDVIVQRAEGRRKRLFVADMDSTMIGQECIDELADFAGLKARVAAITERAMRGEIAFEPALRERVALLKGLPVSVIASTLQERITLTPGGKTLVATMRAHGGYTALVSGGFTAFTGPVAERLGFDVHRGNTLEQQDSTLTGTVSEPILGREAKLVSLKEFRAACGLAPEETLAVGDGANDLAMLGEAGLGVAFHAKPAVAEAAHARLEQADLTALLYAQGYRREEFVEG